MLLIMSMTLYGCSSGKADNSSRQAAREQVTAPFAPGAITLNLTAEPGLNAWNDIANSCTVLIIQAQNASTLNKLMSSPLQLKNLFSGAGTEDGILKVDRYPAMPGQQTTLHIDRSENTRQIAIVAGYYPFPKKQHMALIAIPVSTRSEGWLTKEWFAELTPLSLDIKLGSQSITQIEGAPSEPVVLAQTELAANPAQSTSSQSPSGFPSVPSNISSIQPDISSMVKEK
nr:type VI secretion lipoprotein TssJ [Rahnella woolbedingensis]